MAAGFPRRRLAAYAAKQITAGAEVNLPYCVKLPPILVTPVQRAMSMVAATIE